MEGLEGLQLQVTCKPQPIVQPQSPLSARSSSLALANDNHYLGCAREGGNLLRIVVVSATGLSGVCSNRSSAEVYVFFEIPGKPATQFHTVSARMMEKTVWNSQASLPGYDPGDEVHFTVFDSGDNFMARCTVRASQLVPSGYMGEATLEDDAGRPLAGARLGLVVALPGRDSPGMLITILKDRGKIGAAIVPDRLRNCLLIKKVHDTGLVAEWNQEHPEQPVQAGDVVEAVNHRRGEVEDLLRELASCDNKVCLLVKHSFGQNAGTSSRSHHNFATGARVQFGVKTPGPTRFLAAPMSPRPKALAPAPATWLKDRSPDDVDDDMRIVM